MKRAPFFGLPALVWLLSCVACGQEAAPTTRGAVGVFYGGQVQELQVIARTRETAPTFGFRLDFDDAGAHRVRWEITRPGPLGRRVVEQASQDLPAGRASFDQPLALGIDSPLGTWNVRVSVDDELIIDRALLFTDARP